MKQKLQPTSFLSHLLTLVLVFSGIFGGGASAEVVTLTPTKVTGSTDPYTFTCTNDNETAPEFTLQAKKNKGSAAPTINSTNHDARIYAKGNLIITAATGYNITKVVINLSSQGKQRLAKITSVPERITTQTKGDATVTWTGTSNSITMTVGDQADYGSDGSGKSGQLCFSSVEITYSVDKPISAVATPVFNPAAGYIAKNTKVTITSATEGATIHYTTDGSDPTATSTEYTVDGIVIDKDMTIKAIAVKGTDISEIATAEYKVKVGTPTFSPAAGAVGAGTKVTITSETPDATIYYTTDNTNPTTSSTKYVDGVEVNEAMTIKAIAVKDGLDNSDIATAEYTIKNAASFIFVGEGKPDDSYGLKYKDYATNGTTISNGPVTIKFDAQTEDAWRLWDDGLRVYTTHTPKFTVSGTGIKIKNVTIKVYNALIFKKDNESTEVSISANQSHTFDCTGARSVDFHVSGTSGHAIISIDVEYEKAEKQNPTITFDHAQEGFKDSQTLTYALHDYENAKAPTLIHDMTGLPEFAYSSSDPAVATVDAKTGAISLMGAGSTTIEAAFAGNDYYNPAKASYTLNVTKGTTEMLIDVPANMKVGDTADIEYITNLPAHLLKDLVFTSSNPDVLKVEGNSVDGYKVKALDSGEAVITATYEDNANMSGASVSSDKVTVEYTMEDAPIQWKNEEITCVINNITQPELTGVPESVIVSYSVADEYKSIATVSEDGKIIPHIPGVFYLTASWPESQKDKTTRYNAGSVECIIELLSVAESQRKEGDPKIPTVVIAEGNDTEGDLKSSVLCYSITGGYWYIGYNSSLKLKLTTTESDAAIKYRFVEGAVDFDDISYRKARAQEETPWEDYIEDSAIAFVNDKNKDDGKRGSLEFKAVKGALESPVETLKVSVTTGVDNIEVDGNDSEARYFTLQGVEVKNPGNGIFIRIADGKAVKVIR